MSESQSTTFVGIDLHQDSVAVAVLPAGARECGDVRTLPNDLPKLRRFFERRSAKGAVRACYEAGGCGYVLHRAMKEWGVECEVIAPSLIPVRPGDRCKTDRRDAVRLAQLYRAGELTPIRVPSAEEESVRALVRCRETLTREILSSRHYVLKFLQARGLRFPDGKTNWSGAYWRWLRGLAFEGPDGATFSAYVELLEYKLVQRETIGARIEEIALKDPTYREQVGRLRCLRGIDTLTAITILAEIGDVRRFASPRQLMAYLGLTVREHSSGSAIRRGGITKAGNARCRRVLVEAAWNYRFRARPSATLLDRRIGQPPEVVAHAERAERRLHSRFARLSVRMASSKAVVAVARELAGFVWAVLSADRRNLHPRDSR